LEAILEQYRDLNMSELIVEILGSKDTAAYQVAVSIIEKLGIQLATESSDHADLAIAPLLTFKLSPEEANKPRLGTLIFHPSPLPHGRGASALKWAYRRSEPITAATWLWAVDKIDAGDICEMEIIKIDYSMSPRAFYETHILPALERTLERALNNLQRGFIRRVPQLEAYASFDLKL
jgi:methionyl-tRNA formyltransferase